MLHLIEDAADAVDAGDAVVTPAQYSAQAAIFAVETGAALMHLPVNFDETRFPDARQHVTADGTLVTSGLVWFERLSGQPVGAASHIDEVIACAAVKDVVVPTSVDLADQLAVLAGRRHVPVRRYRVVREREMARVVSDDGHVITCSQQDAFGRWSVFTLEASNDAIQNGAIHIALVGEESGQRNVYPATLAALADAAGAHALNLNVRFVAPETLNNASTAEAFAGIDGIVLPGGADMRRVPGQITAARYAWESSVPVLGLCLGMQSMTTALARIALRTEDIDLAETASGAGLPSFVPIQSNHEGAMFHRLGLQPLTVASGTRLAAILADKTSIRCNHRYKLNPALVAPLMAAGVLIPARDASGHIADAVEAPAHPFFIGMQGHPELSSASGAPHPLLSAFMEAARRG